MVFHPNTATVVDTARDDDHYFPPGKQVDDAFDNYEDYDDYEDEEAPGDLDEPEFEKPQPNESEEFHDDEASTTGVPNDEHWDDPTLDPAPARTANVRERARQAGKPSGDDDLSGDLAHQLITLLHYRFELRCDQHGNGYAVHRSRPNMAVTLEEAVRIAADVRYRTTDSTVGQGPRDTAVLHLRSLAQREQVKPVGIRRVAHDGTVYLDLADEDNTVVIVGEPGEETWRFAKDDEQLPVCFRRGQLTAPMVKPVHGGSNQELLDFLIMDELSKNRLWAYIVGSYQRPHEPYPILLLSAPDPGAGKTAATNLVLEMTDAQRMLRAEPAKEDDIWLAADHTATAVWENFNAFPSKFSSTVAAMVFGGGSTKRKLYSDATLHISGGNPVNFVWNGMLEPSMCTGEIQDRLAAIHLRRLVGDDRFLSFQDLEAKRAALIPAAMGAALQEVHEQINFTREFASESELRAHLRPDNPPSVRIDFWGQTLMFQDHLHGWNTYDEYVAERADAASLAVTSKPFTGAIIEHGQRLVGTPKQILEAAVTAKFGRTLSNSELTRHHFPTVAGTSAVAALKKMIAPMKDLGWTVRETGEVESRTKQKIWEVVPPAGLETRAEPNLATPARFTGPPLSEQVAACFRAHGQPVHGDGIDIAEAIGYEPQPGEDVGRTIHQAFTRYLQPEGWQRFNQKFNGFWYSEYTPPASIARRDVADHWDDFDQWEDEFAVPARDPFDELSQTPEYRKWLATHEQDAARWNHGPDVLDGLDFDVDDYWDNEPLSDAEIAALDPCAAR